MRDYYINMTEPFLTVVAIRIVLYVLAAQFLKTCFNNRWFIVYDNQYASIIDIYFYEFILPFKPWTLALQNIWDTLSDVLDKGLCFSLIKIEPVSIKPKPSCD